jgi:hypothetical protein
MLKYTALIVLSCYLALGVWTAAMAAGEHPVAKKILDQVHTNEADLRVARATLEGQASMGEAELCAYLRKALWTVYNALSAYSIDKMDVPDDLQTLVAEGYLSSWPDNPLNEWKPMRVLNLGDGFAPGDFVMQWAPAYRQSFVGSVKDARLRPLSYAIAVYGLTENTEPSGPHSALDHNSWVIVPRGIVALLDTYTESADETLRKLQRIANEASNQEKADVQK